MSDELSDDEHERITKELTDAIRAAAEKASASGMPSNVQFTLCIACAAAIVQGAALVETGRILNQLELAGEFVGVLSRIEFSMKGTGAIAVDYVHNKTTMPLQGSHKGKPS